MKLRLLILCILIANITFTRSYTTSFEMNSDLTIFRGGINKENDIYYCFKGIDSQAQYLILVITSSVLINSASLYDFNTMTSLGDFKNFIYEVGSPLDPNNKYCLLISLENDLKVMFSVRLSTTMSTNSDAQNTDESRVVKSIFQTVTSVDNITSSNAPELMTITEPIIANSDDQKVYMDSKFTLLLNLNVNINEGARLLTKNHLVLKLKLTNINLSNVSITSNQNISDGDVLASKLNSMPAYEVVSSADGGFADYILFTNFDEDFINGRKFKLQFSALVLKKAQQVDATIEVFYKNTNTKISASTNLGIITPEKYVITASVSEINGFDSLYTGAAWPLVFTIQLPFSDPPEIFLVSNSDDLLFIPTTCDFSLMSSSKASCVIFRNNSPSNYAGAVNYQSTIKIINCGLKKGVASSFKMFVFIKSTTPTITIKINSNTNDAVIKFSTIYANPSWNVSNIESSTCTTCTNLFVKENTSNFFLTAYPTDTNNIIPVENGITPKTVVSLSSALFNLNFKTQYMKTDEAYDYVIANDFAGDWASAYTVQSDKSLGPDEVYLKGSHNFLFPKDLMTVKSANCVLNWASYKSRDPSNIPNNYKLTGKINNSISISSLNISNNKISINNYDPATSNNIFSIFNYLYYKYDNKGALIKSTDTIKNTIGSANNIHNISTNCASYNSTILSKSIYSSYEFIHYFVDKNNKIRRINRWFNLLPQHGIFNYNIQTSVKNASDYLPILYYSSNYDSGICLLALNFNSNTLFNTSGSRNSSTKLSIFLSGIDLIDFDDMTKYPFENLTASGYRNAVQIGGPYIPNTNTMQVNQSIGESYDDYIDYLNARLDVGVLTSLSSDRYIVPVMCSKSYKILFTDIEYSSNSYKPRLTYTSIEQAMTQGSAPLRYLAYFYKWSKAPQTLDTISSFNLCAYDGATLNNIPTMINDLVGKSDYLILMGDQELKNFQISTDQYFGTNMLSSTIHDIFLYKNRFNYDTVNYANMLVITNKTIESLIGILSSVSDKSSSRLNIFGNSLTIPISKRMGLFYGFMNPSASTTPSGATAPLSTNYLNLIDTSAPQMFTFDIPPSELLKNAASSLIITTKQLKTGNLSTTTCFKVTCVVKSPLVFRLKLYFDDNITDKTIYSADLDQTDISTTNDKSILVHFKAIAFSTRTLTIYVCNAKLNDDTGKITLNTVEHYLDNPPPDITITTNLLLFSYTSDTLTSLKSSNPVSQNAYKSPYISTYNFNATQMTYTELILEVILDHEIFYKMKIKVDNNDINSLIIDQSIPVKCEAYTDDGSFNAVFNSCSTDNTGFIQITTVDFIMFPGKNMPSSFKIRAWPVIAQTMNSTFTVRTFFINEGNELVISSEANATNKPNISATQVYTPASDVVTITKIQPLIPGFTSYIEFTLNMTDDSKFKDTAGLNEITLYLPSIKFTANSSKMLCIVNGVQALNCIVERDYLYIRVDKIDLLTIIKFVVYDFEIRSQNEISAENYRFLFALSTLTNVNRQTMMQTLGSLDSNFDTSAFMNYDELNKYNLVVIKQASSSLNPNSNTTITLDLGLQKISNLDSPMSIASLKDFYMVVEIPSQMILLKDSSISLTYTTYNNVDLPQTIKLNNISVYGRAFTATLDTTSPIDEYFYKFTLTITGVRAPIDEMRVELFRICIIGDKEVFLTIPTFRTERVETDQLPASNQLDNMIYYRGINFSYNDKLYVTFPNYNPSSNWINPGIYQEVKTKMMADIDIEDSYKYKNATITVNTSSKFISAIPNYIVDGLFNTNVSLYVGLACNISPGKYFLLLDIVGSDKSSSYYSDIKPIYYMVNYNPPLNKVRFYYSNNQEYSASTNNISYGGSRIAFWAEALMNMEAITINFSKSTTDAIYDPPASLTVPKISSSRITGYYKQDVIDPTVQKYTVSVSGNNCYEPNIKLIAFSQLAGISPIDKTLKISSSIFYANSSISSDIQDRTSIKFVLNKGISLTKYTHLFCSLYCKDVKEPADKDIAVYPIPANTSSTQNFYAFIDSANEIPISLTGLSRVNDYYLKCVLSNSLNYTAVNATSEVMIKLNTTDTNPQLGPINPAKTQVLKCINIETQKQSDTFGSSAQQILQEEFSVKFSDRGCIVVVDSKGIPLDLYKSAIDASCAPAQPKLRFLQDATSASSTASSTQTPVTFIYQFCLKQASLCSQDSDMKDIDNTIKNLFSTNLSSRRLLLESVSKFVSKLPNPEKSNFIGFTTVVPDVNYDFKKVTYTVSMTAAVASNRVTFTIDFKASINNEQVCYISVFADGKSTFIQSDFIGCKTYCGSADGYKNSQTIKIIGDVPADTTSKYKASYICKQNMLIANIYSPAQSSASISIPKAAATVSSSSPAVVVSSSTAASPQVSVSVSSSTNSTISFCNDETDFDMATIKSFPECCASGQESAEDSTVCHTRRYVFGMYVIGLIILLLS